jgi:hypothetical protein
MGAAASISMLACCFGTVIAAEWSITSTLNQRFVADDNIQMQSGDASETFGSTTSPESRYRYRSPALDLNVFGRFDFARFNDSLYNREDQTLRSVSSYETTRSIWGLNADLERDSTRTSEVTDTGNFQSIATRLLYRVNPSYTFQLSQRDQIRLDVGYADVSYDTNSLTDYQYYSSTAGWARVLSPATSVRLFGNAARQDTEIGVKSDSFAVQAEVTHFFSPRLETTASVGPSYASTKSSTAKNTSIGVRFSAQLKYVLDEQTSMTASASQSVDPSGGGSSRDRLVFGLSADHRFLPRLSFALSASLQDDSDPTGNNPASDRTYYSVSPSVRWRIAREWDLSASYRYRRQELGSGTDAESNAAVVSLNFHPKAWFIAR